MKSLLTAVALLIFGAVSAQPILNFSGQIENAPGEPITVEVLVYDNSFLEVEATIELTTEPNGNIIPASYTLEIDTWAVLSASVDNCNTDSQTLTFIEEASFDDGLVYDVVINLDYCSNIYGCTDPVATNYNPDATEDDGSCIYDGCDFNEITLNFEGNFGLSDTAYVYWNLSHYNGNAIQTGIYSADSEPENICLLDDCYELSMMSNHPDFSGSYSVMMTGAVLFSGNIDGDESQNVVLTSAQLGCDPNLEVFGCTDPEAENYDPNATLDDGSCTYFEDTYGCTDPEALNFDPAATADDGSCEYPDPIYGCTDSEAFNYNPEATEDDGSCIYDIECAISFTAVADSMGNLIMYVFPDENIYNAESVLWDFGDGSTSNALFPIHGYATDGPYTLCLTAFFPDGNGGLCEDTFCMELTSDMINPPGMGSAGFNINIVPPGGVTNVDEANIESAVSIWPNPTSHQVQIEIHTDEASETFFNLFDITGKIVHRKAIPLSTGENLISIPVDRLTPGIYLLHITDGNHSQVHRVTVK